MATRKILVVCNPSAGKGKSIRILPKLRAFLQAHQVDFRVIETTAENNATAIVRACDFPYTEILVLGGDGTLNEVVNGMKPHIPIGIIPGGTGNDYIKNFHLGNSEEEIFTTALKGKLCKVDVGQCNNRLFLNGVGIGFDGQVAKNAEQSEIWLSGWPEYYYHVLRNLAFFDAVPLKFTIDGKAYDESLFLLTIAKGTTFGGSFKLTPQASLTDGRLTICKISKIAAMKRLLNIHRLKAGSHGVLSEVEFLQGTSIVVEDSPGAEAHLDGEYIGNPPFNFSIKPAYLTLRIRK